MREMEFLPAWYHRTRRRKRIVTIEGWLLLALVAALGSWLGFARQSVSGSELVLASLQRQVEQAHSDQRMLTEQLELRQKLQDRAQIIASLGFPAEMTRLLQTLDSVMPAEMSLTEFDCTTDEQVRPVTSVAAVRAAGDKDKQIDRRLKIKLAGVTPSDVDLANLLYGLTNVPFFEQVSVNARNKLDAGHVMREFEVTFSMSLNQQTGS